MDWTRGRNIGRGSSATVSIAIATEFGSTFAVKSAELSRSEIIQREHAMLSTLECPHIITELGNDVTSENGKLVYNLFLEYARGGSVSNEIQRRGGRLDEGTIRSYTTNILLGMEYLHSNGIAHCDIKCDNILVTENGPKIADFGCAKRVGELRSGDWPEKESVCGTPAYMGPEVARGERQSFPADIWALGCTVIEMAIGRAPWAGVPDPVSALYQIEFSDKVPKIPGFISEQAQDFLGKCLKTDPMERWSASELLNHDFVVGVGPATCNVITPKSVLDKKLWNPFQELDTCWGSSQTSSLDSPIERIQELAGTESPNWEFDDTWVIVRSTIGESKVEEKARIYQSQCSDMKCFACDSLEYFIDVHAVPSFIVRGTLGLEVPILVPCNCTKDALSVSSNFEIEIVIRSLQMALREINPFVITFSILFAKFIFLYHLIEQITFKPFLCHNY